jgi:hypothetical protein
VIDFAEIWIAFVLLGKGQAARVLESDFVEGLRPRIETACKAIAARDGEGLELEWGEETGAAALARLASATDGKQFYVSWLKDRYGYNIARLNEAYGLDSTSFSDLAESDFRQVDRSRAAVREDDRLFLEYLATTVQQKVAEMFQACAPGRKVAWKRKRT